MKKLLLLVGVICLVLIACGGGSESPTAVAKKWMTAVEKADLNGIKATSTEETATLMGSMLEKASESAKERGKPVSFSEEIDGDTAVVTVKYADDEDTINLKKIDGKWKVDFKIK
jgi:ABC-type glycerol-3-phosphate transport system substrate-binding protein